MLQSQHRLAQEIRKSFPQPEGVSQEELHAALREAVFHTYVGIESLLPAVLALEIMNCESGPFRPRDDFFATFLDVHECNAPEELRRLYGEEKITAKQAWQYMSGLSERERGLLLAGFAFLLGRTDGLYDEYLIAAMDSLWRVSKHSGG